MNPAKAIPPADAPAHELSAEEEVRLQRLLEALLDVAFGEVENDKEC